MIWNFFKKKKEEPAIDDLVLSKLKPGYLVDYDMKTWKVTAHNQYRWHEGGVTDEWELKAGDTVWYLEREEDDGVVQWGLCQKHPISEIEGDIAKEIIDNEDPPEIILYQGARFRLEDDDIGEFYADGSNETSEFVAWDFEESEGERFLTIEQWGENDFDMMVGFEVEEYQFTNILPGEL